MLDILSADVSKNKGSTWSGFIDHQLRESEYQNEKKTKKGAHE